jgi:hypothetical protein
VAGDESPNELWIDLLPALVDNPLVSVMASPSLSVSGETPRASGGGLADMGVEDDSRSH